MSSSEYEQLHSSFKGENNRHIGDDYAQEIIVDSIDIGLYRLVEPAQHYNESCKEYFVNKSFWGDLNQGSICHGDYISLNEFQISEWLPSAPGRYFTPDALIQREEAKWFWDRSKGEYIPLGKTSMVLGGIGSVRLAPRTVRGGDVCFWGASSNGISHQGIPLIVPIDIAQKAKRQMRLRKTFSATLKGTLWPLPTEMSPIKFDKGMPKYYLFVDGIENIKESSDKMLTSIAITYSSKDYQLMKTQIGSINTSPIKSWCFASFNPNTGIDGLRDSVEWMSQYVSRYSFGRNETTRPSIVANFDEIIDHFEYPVEFRLTDLLSGKLNTELLEFYGKYFNFNIRQEIVMGDKFENIRGSTIVNRSKVDNAFTFKSAIDNEEMVNYINEIKAVVEKSNNAAANTLFKEFTTELKQEAPQKTVLKECWDGLLTILPDTAKLIGACAAIAALVS